MSTCVFSEDFAQVCCMGVHPLMVFWASKGYFQLPERRAPYYASIAHRRAKLRLVKNAIIQLNTVKWAELQQTEFPDQNIVIITTSNPLEKYTWKASEHIIILKLHVHINTFNTMNKKKHNTCDNRKLKRQTGRLCIHVKLLTEAVSCQWTCQQYERERESIEVNEIGLKSEFCCDGATADSGATKAHSHWSAAILSVLNDRLKYQR